MNNTTRLYFNKLDNARTSANVENSRIINNYKLKAIKNKFDIKMREKQIKNVNNKIYYISKVVKNLNYTR